MWIEFIWLLVRFSGVVLYTRHRNYAFYKKENNLTNLSIIDFSKKGCSQSDE
jgi:hypothetical protein